MYLTFICAGCLIEIQDLIFDKANKHAQKHEVLKTRVVVFLFMVFLWLQDML